MRKGAPLSFLIRRSLCVIQRNEVAYDLFITPDQRHQSWKRIRDHRTGIHNGIRYRQDAELCPRRRHHGGRIYFLLYHQLSRTFSAGICPFSIIVCTVLGIVVERLAYKPLRQAPSLAVLITAIGVSYFLQNAALLDLGLQPETFSSVTGSWTLKLLTDS